MPFRIRAFILHFLASAGGLALVLGSLWAGWYKWPGWFLVGALPVALIIMMVDVGLGPLTTLVIANPKKPRSEFKRDLIIVVLVQLIALGYGTLTLWKGRPLFYAFSVDRLEIVQASDLADEDVEKARKENPSFVPTLLSLPRWVWAPLPDDENERTKIIGAAAFGGKDVISMPRYFKPYEQAHASVRAQLKPIEELRGLTKSQKERLAPEVARLGELEKIGTLLFDGSSKSAVAVLDRNTLEIKAILKQEE